MKFICLNCLHRAVLPATSAERALVREADVADFAKTGLVEGEQSLGAGSYAASAASAACGVDPGYSFKDPLQRISSICFQVNSADCFPMVCLKG